MKKTKTFKIGEYAVGGIVVANINKSIVEVQFKDWNTKEVITECKIDGSKFNSRNELLDFLNENTSSYYADKIVEWIDSFKLAFPLNNNFV